MNGAQEMTVDIDEGKKAEEQSKFLAQLQAILNVLPAYTWYGPPSGSLTFVNKRQADVLGVPKDHPLRFGIDIGAQWDDWIPLLHPDDQEEGRKYWSNSLRTGEGYEHSYRVRTAQGDYRWFLTRVEPLRASDGTLLLWIGATLDIEELKCAEQALRESEAKFRDYAETASDWFWEIGPDYKFTLLTENAFGSHAADRIGTGCWDHALDLETEPEKWRLVWATLDSRKPFRDFVYRVLSGNGSPMYVRASGKPMFDANGEFRGYRGTGTDVTAIMRAQEALRESERRSRSAIDGIAGLVAIMAPNGEFETANRQVFEYFGRSLEWLKNWRTNDAVHPEDLPNVVEFFKRAIASGNPYHIDQRLRRFDGEYRWFDTRGVPVRDDSGRIARWYVLLMDIEDRTRALARLDQMQSDFAHMNRVSMMGELAASLSHEITQPIASARNNARAAQNFLDRQPPDLGEVREALSCVVGDTDRAGDMIDRIRDHIKKAPPRKAHFDLNEAVKQVLVLGRSAINKNGVSVRTRLSEGLFPIHGDRVQLQQVVLNLLLNAVDAMGSREAGARELLISTEQDLRGVLVAVHDSGPGIDPSHLEHVFDAFYTTKSSGMGMGLTICRSIIDAHGGRLWAEANEPCGAVFQFTLPAGRRSFTGWQGVRRMETAG
jgi:PAS domain S-box-containing protein